MNKPAAAHTPPAAIEIRFGQVGLVQVRIRTTDPGAILDELTGKVATAPRFFNRTGVCLDLSALQKAPEVSEVRAVMDAIRRAGMLTIGLAGGCANAEALTDALELPVLPNFRTNTQPVPVLGPQAAGPQNGAAAARGTPSASAPPVALASVPTVGAAQDEDFGQTASQTGAGSTGSTGGTGGTAAQARAGGQSGAGAQSGTGVQAAGTGVQAGTGAQVGTGAQTGTGAQGATSSPSGVPTRGVPPLEPALSIHAVSMPPSIAPPAPPETGVPALIHSQTVRSGQRVYGRHRDLIITATVGAGAEVMADGCVHVYGALRGRAMAGAHGDLNARVFCQEFNAELVSIAGVFRVFETIPPELAGKPVQAWLEGDDLHFAPIC